MWLVTRSDTRRSRCEGRGGTAGLRQGGMVKTCPSELRSGSWQLVAVVPLPLPPAKPLNPSPWWIIQSLAWPSSLHMHTHTGLVSARSGNLCSSARAFTSTAMHGWRCGLLAFNTREPLDQLSAVVKRYPQASVHIWVPVTLRPGLQNWRQSFALKRASHPLQRGLSSRAPLHRIRQPWLHSGILRGNSASPGVGWGGQGLSQIFQEGQFKGISEYQNLIQRNEKKKSKAKPHSLKITDISTGYPSLTCQCLMT